jgi:hypothetical protein
MSVAMEVSLLYGVGSLRALQGGLVAPSEIRDRCVHRWVASVTSIPHFIPQKLANRANWGGRGRTRPDDRPKKSQLSATAAHRGGRHATSAEALENRCGR